MQLHLVSFQAGQGPGDEASLGPALSPGCGE